MMNDEERACEQNRERTRSNETLGRKKMSEENIFKVANNIVTDVNKNKIGTDDSDNFKYLTDTGNIGIKTKNGGVIILNFGDKLFEVEIGRTLAFDRKYLAEFLWAAATLLDSEERYRPTGEMVGINYEV